VLLLLGAAVFATAFVYDWVNVRFLQAVSQRNPASASFWSAATALIGLIGLAGILKYSYWLIIPDILGIAAGAYFGVKTAAGPLEGEIVVVVYETDKPREEREHLTAN
jgi:hypothetical protein